MSAWGVLSSSSGRRGEEDGREGQLLRELSSRSSAAASSASEQSVSRSSDSRSEEEREQEAAGGGADGSQDDGSEQELTLEDVLSADSHSALQTPQPAPPGAAPAKAHSRSQTMFDRLGLSSQQQRKPPTGAAQAVADPLSLLLADGGWSASEAPAASSPARLSVLAASASSPMASPSRRSFGASLGLNIDAAVRGSGDGDEQAAAARAGGSAGSGRRAEAEEEAAASADPPSSSTSSSSSSASPSSPGSQSPASASASRARSGSRYRSAIMRNRRRARHSRDAAPAAADGRSSEGAGKEEEAEAQAAAAAPAAAAEAAEAAASVSGSASPSVSDSPKLSQLTPTFHFSDGGDGEDGGAAAGDGEQQEREAAQQAVSARQQQDAAREAEDEEDERERQAVLVASAAAAAAVAREEEAARQQQAAERERALEQEREAERARERERKAEEEQRKREEAARLSREREKEKQRQREQQRLEQERAAKEAERQRQQAEAEVAAAAAAAAVSAAAAVASPGSPVPGETVDDWKRRVRRDVELLLRCAVADQQTLAAAVIGSSGNARAAQVACLILDFLLQLEALPLASIAPASKAAASSSVSSFRSAFSSMSLQATVSLRFLPSVARAKSVDDASRRFPHPLPAFSSLSSAPHFTLPAAASQPSSDSQQAATAASLTPQVRSFALSAALAELHCCVSLAAQRDDRAHLCFLFALCAQLRHLSRTHPGLAPPAPSPVMDRVYALPFLSTLPLLPSAAAPVEAFLYPAAAASASASAAALSVLDWWSLQLLDCQALLHQLLLNAVLEAWQLRLPPLQQVWAEDDSLSSPLLESHFLVFAELDAECRQQGWTLAQRQSCLACCLHALMTALFNSLLSLPNLTMDLGLRVKLLCSNLQEMAARQVGDGFGSALRQSPQLQRVQQLAMFLLMDKSRCSLAELQSLTPDLPLLTIHHLLFVFLQSERAGEEDDAVSPHLLQQIAQQLAASSADEQPQLPAQLVLMLDWSEQQLPADEYTRLQDERRRGDWQPSDALLHEPQFRCLASPAQT